MIGVLDSGVGGLCALKTLRRLCPEEDLVYLADTAHLPYGEHARGDICRYTARALCFFLSEGVDRVLLACGTASALALDFCRHSFPFPVFGVLTPAVLAAARATVSRRIGVVATRASISCGAYERLLHRYAPSANIFSCPAPDLVSLAEAGDGDLEKIYKVIGASLCPLREAGIDTLVLGCTHFSLLKEGFSAFFPGVKLIDAATIAAEDLVSTYFPRHERGRLRLYATQDEQHLALRANAVLGERVRAKRILI